MTQFVVSHKTLDDPRFNSRKIIYVNQKITKKMSDNCLISWDKDNIDELNPFYCELTALYWIWKNDKSDVVSFEHYRRVFINRHNIGFSYSFLNENDISDILKKYKMILPSIHVYRKTVKNQLVYHHNKEDEEVLEKTLKTMYPDYSSDYDEVMNGHRCTLFNMFVMPKELMDSYCSFLFPLLNEVYRIRKDDIASRDTYQKRAIGFLSERIFNVWVHHNVKPEEIYHSRVAWLEYRPIFQFTANRFLRLIGDDYDKGFKSK